MVLLSWCIGPAAFFAIYLTSLSLAGAVGIALSTVQHTFEHSCASDGAGWESDAGTLSGTSFLILPGWLTRITLMQIPAQLKCILWDIRAQRIISVRAYRRQKATGVGVLAVVS